MEKKPVIQLYQIAEYTYKNYISVSFHSPFKWIELKFYSPDIKTLLLESKARKHSKWKQYVKLFTL